MLDLSEIKFNADGLVAAVAQDFENGEVLMLAYMNREALEKTLKTGKCHYYSRSRKKLWLKGETSGHVQLVKEMRYDCDGDAILVKIDQKTAACHTGHRSCFYRTFDGKEEVNKIFNPDTVYGNDRGNSYILNRVFQIIEKRIEEFERNPKTENSYVRKLLGKGEDYILRKIGEEALEVILAKKENVKEHIIEESADLIFHLLVLLGTSDIKLEDVYSELRKRHKPD